MIYLERAPRLELRPWVRSIWYCRAPGLLHARERVLPNGCMQILVNLAGEHLTECEGELRDGGGEGLEQRRTGKRVAGALVMGARLRYEIVDTRDMEEIAGAVLRPGGFGPMFRERADLLREGSAGLEEMWGGRGPGMRERMREEGTPEGALRVMEESLLARSRVGVQGRGGERAAERVGMVREAISLMRRPGRSVRECAGLVGVSERRLLAVFREEVGVGPKGWMRVQRFQAATRALHRGVEVRWAELASACGYYDQAHFANEFRAFSGVDPTTYCAGRGLWQNHVALL